MNTTARGSHADQASVIKCVEHCIDQRKSHQQLKGEYRQIENTTDAFLDIYTDFKHKESNLRDID